MNLGLCFQLGKVEQPLVGCGMKTPSIDEPQGVFRIGMAAKKMPNSVGAGMPPVLHHCERYGL